MSWLAFIILSLACCIADASLLKWQRDAEHPGMARRDSWSLEMVTSKQGPRLPVAIKEAKHFLPMRQYHGEIGSSRALRAALGTNGTGKLQPASNGASYAIDIEFGSQSFEVVFDTGSADLWIAQEDFECVSYYYKKYPQAYCGFGPLYKGGFEEGDISNENFNITYGDEEFLTGTLGYQDVTFAGLTVKKQEAALVDYAYWDGDNYTSGLMGFAYPALTSAFPGTNPKKDNIDATIQYNPWILNAIKEGLVDEPIFGVALERGKNGGGGFLALGGYPPVNFDKQFASTPIRIIKLGKAADFATNYSYYTIVPDGFVVKSPVGSGGDDFRGLDVQDDGDDEVLEGTNFPCVVDTGTTLMYLPYNLTRYITGLFDPPAIYIPYSGLYETLCTATPPQVGVTINGTDFMISGEDLLLTGDMGYDPDTGLCVIGIQPSPGPYILGDPFLKNVVAVFDLGANEMHFAEHMTY